MFNPWMSIDHEPNIDLVERIEMNIDHGLNRTTSLVIYLESISDRLPTDD